MGEPADDGWDEAAGTALAGPAYSDAIAQSEPDFENESGTAVAGQDYVENIRKSRELNDQDGVRAAVAAAMAPVAPVAAPVIANPGFAPRSPTMAFGTPVMLRAPATDTPRTPGLRTPAPGLPTMRGAQSNPIPTPSRSTQARKPAPAPFVDEPYLPSGAPERRSGPIAIAVKSERRSEPIIAPAPIAPVAPPVQAREVDVAFDNGEEDDSASDLDAFDNAETIGQPSSAPIVHETRRPTPAPLRPSSSPMRAESPSAPYPYRPPSEEDLSSGSRPLPGLPPMSSTQRGLTPAPVMQPMRPILPPMEAKQPNPQATSPTQQMPGMQPVSATEPMPHVPPFMQQGHAPMPMPTSYPMVSAEAMQAFRSPLSLAPALPSPVEAPSAAPKRRVALIAVCVVLVVGLGIGAALVLTSGDDARPVASATKPAATTATPPPTPPTPPKSKPDGVEITEPAPKPDEVATTATAKTTTAPATTTTAPTTTTTAPTTTTTAPTKTTTKTVVNAAKPATATKTPPRKVTKKPVRKAPAKRRPAAKATAKKPCSGLDCL